MNISAALSTLSRDLRYGLRVLAKSRGMTAVAILSLALGIGATTAIFSTVYGVLISPYPYSRPAEIWSPAVRNAKNPNQGRGMYKAVEVLRMRELPAFSMVMATLPDNGVLKRDGAVENFTTIAVTANAFQFLAVDPILGRTILPSDIRADGTAEPVIVLSFKAWHRLFEAREDAIGKTVVLNDVPHTVVGVMPSRFGWWTDDGGWVTLPLDARSDRGMAPIVRLAPGVGASAAKQQLHALHQQLAQATPADFFPREGFTSDLRNYLDITVASGEMQSSLRLLFGAVGFLLLIACANVANLQLARATARRREIALRMSVGAGRGRILRQLLTESVTLSLVGGVLGVLLAIGITRAVVALLPDFYVPNEARISVNGYALAFSAAVSILTGILFGLAPAIQCSRLDLTDALKDGGKGTGMGSAGGRTRSLLVVAEVALSVVLLVGAGLTVRGFVGLQTMDVGFQADRLLMVGVQLPAQRYGTWEQRVAFTQSLLDRAAAIPGVQAAAIGNGGLPFGGPRSPYSIPGVPEAGRNPIIVGLISADYPRAMGIPLIAGRAITAQDVGRADRVALINQSASKLWPAGQSPIGQRIHLGLLERVQGSLRMSPGPPAADVTVIGILRDTRNDGLRSPTAPSVFLPYTVVAPTGRTLAVQARAGNPAALLGALREQVRQLDKDLPLGRPITMDEVLGDQTKQPRFNMALFSFFGGLGLSLAAIGLFSVLSYSVASRTHEIGVRMALGAERGHVLTLVLAMGAKLVVAGLVIGIAGSLLLAKYLASEVFALPATDPVSLIGVVLLLAIAACLACVLPARRAAAMDPMNALRHD
jgi:putative ABC transport system permease protein